MYKFNGLFCKSNSVKDGDESMGFVGPPFLTNFAAYFGEGNIVKKKRMKIKRNAINLDSLETGEKKENLGRRNIIGP
jgi:hypothetical protein